ncbi:aminotransferase, partial [Candidatus Bathyarchaeota archaeon ex4484_205]
MTELSPFKEKRLLMVPGPVEVHPRVLRAMSQPMIGHLDPDFVSLLDEILDMLRRVFQTRGDVIILTGSGTSAMEAAVGNVIERGDKVLSVVSGLFGRRFAEIA